ncbi:hypothetical protein CR513_23776, partial [Mucuna pruriens]
METKGHIVNIPPLFKGKNYDNWKQRMMSLFYAYHIDMWDVVENDNHILTNKEGEEIPRSLLNQKQKTRFQTVINNLRSLRKTYNNYDHITKNLSFRRRWKPHVTTLRASKDLKKLPMEELLGTLKLSIKSLQGRRSGDTLDKDCSDEDELSFILRKIQSIWNHKKGLTRKKNSRNKKKHFIKKKKSLMATWEDLDLTSSEDEDEEANLCLWQIQHLKMRILSRTSFKFIDSFSWIQRTKKKTFKTAKIF